MSMSGCESRGDPLGFMHNSIDQIVCLDGQLCGSALVITETEDHISLAYCGTFIYENASSWSTYGSKSFRRLPNPLTPK